MGLRDQAGADISGDYEKTKERSSAEALGVAGRQGRLWSEPCRGHWGRLRHWAWGGEEGLLPWGPENDWKRKRPTAVLGWKEVMGEGGMEGRVQGAGRPQASHHGIGQSLAVPFIFLFFFGGQRWLLVEKGRKEERGRGAQREGLSRSGEQRLQGDQGGAGVTVSTLQLGRGGNPTASGTQDPGSPPARPEASVVAMSSWRPLNFSF